MVVSSMFTRLSGVVFSVITIMVLSMMSFTAQAQIYSCFPSCVDTDAKFIDIMDDSSAPPNMGYNSLSGQSTKLYIVSQTQDVDWGLFDAEIGGIWDSVDTAGKTAYRVYSDANFTGDSGSLMLIDEIFSDDPEVVDNGWANFSITPDIPQAEAALDLANARYVYLVEISNVDIGGAFSDNRIKIRAADAVVLTGAKSSFSFTGASDGALSIIYPNGFGDLSTTTYDGDWSFDLIVNSPDGSPIDSFEMWDGDFDHGDGVIANDTDDVDTSNSVLPDFNESPNAVLEDAKGIGSPSENNTFAGFSRGDAVTIEVTDPSGNVYINSNPSGSSEWEKFEIRTNSHAQGCDSTLADYCVDSLQTGIWNVQVKGLDLNNLNALYFLYNGLGGDTRESLVGNYVWVDENGDGLQDAGEPGISGVLVQLFDAFGILVGEAVTDSAGGYSIPVFLQGNYTVQVDESTLPAGMLQTQHPVNAGSDFGNQTIPYDISVSLDESNLTADFGYNFGDSENNTGDGALGDRVWVDVDGDGVQDSGEPGIGGVELTIYTDSDGNGLIEPGTDAPYAGAVDQDGNTGTGTAVTDADGRYVFSSLPQDGYVVVVNPATLPGGHTQTGDPDDFGQLALNPDHQTTSPILIEPGDAYLNVDFGYQPDAGTLVNTIGDTVWFDSNADGVQDAGEPGIGGVTVSLLDSNGDAMATAVTDANGLYLFEGLADGTYSVAVTDTDGVLLNLDQTGDPDGVLDDQSTTSVASGVSDLDQDFGYVPLGHMPAEGLIGDTVWLDIDGDGIEDAGEPGIGDVLVNLYDSTGALQAQTITNGDGFYSFGGLDPAGSYVVEVDTSTLPLGLVNSGDPDDPTSDNQNPGNSESNVDLSVSTDGINLDQDFGYVAASTPGTIGDYIWLDTNANGINDGLAGADGTPGTADDEPGIEGVTLDLYVDTNGDGLLQPGEPQISSTITDSTGAYLFEGLPGGNYIVDVTDEAGLLNGYWHSLGAADTNDNSQSDPYAVTLPDGGAVDTADFGYYVELASVGDLVWFDANADGIQDADEPGIEGVEVTLTIDYPDSSTQTVLTTLTDANGEYSFDNLLADEDYNGDPTDGSPEPVFTITVETPLQADNTPLLSSPIDEGGDDALDSDDPNGEIAQPMQGQVDDTNDFGYYDLGSISGNVSEDIDRDGTVEGPLANVVINLYEDSNQDGLPDDLNGDGVIDSADIVQDADGNPQTTSTDGTGDYEFVNVPAGSYVVQEVDLDGYESILDEDATDPGDDSPANTVIDDNYIPVTITVDLTLMMAEDDTGNNFVDSPLLASIGDTVWFDHNANGIQDVGEDGIGNVSVTLLDSNGDPVDTMPTDATGFYQFTGLPAGTYTVVVDAATLPAGVQQTHDYDDPVTTSPVTVNEAEVTIAPGENQDEVDFGYRPLGSIGDLVWNDINANGIMDGTEAGIADVTVTLTGPNGTVEMQTDASGMYLFTGLPVGNYTVSVSGTALDGLQQTHDFDDQITTNPATPLTADTMLVLNPDNTVSSNLEMDFGYRAVGSIAGTVTEDTTGDGNGDTPIATDVNLYEDTNENGVVDAGDVLVDTVSTDPVDGSYSFEDVTPGTYVLEEVQPDGLADVSDDDTTPEDTNPADSGTPVDNNIPVTVMLGEDDNNNDFVDVRLGSITGNVSEDSDADGVGDTPLEDVIIELFEDTNGDGFYQVGEPSVMTTTTDDGGNYSFVGLLPGNYVVVETQPNDPNGDPYTSVSDQDQEHDGDDPQDDNFDVDESIGVTVEPGETDAGNNFVEKAPDPGVPAIDIRKQAEGPDVREFSAGDSIDFEIEVTNTGDVDLTNVQVTDPLLPICDNTIGALSAGESVTYTCTTTAPTYQETANTTVVVFEDSFDTNTGWVINPNGTDTATEGMFEVANPEYTSAGSYDFQLSDNPDGSDGNTLVTGALAGADYTANDVDNGVTSARSPSIQLPAKGITIIDLSYYFSHSYNYTDPENDYFKIKLLDANSTDELVLLDERMVFNVWRHNRDWDALSEDISSFNGRTVYLYIEASDSEFSSIRTNVIEAGVDEIKITNDPRDHIVFEDDFETNIGWVINPDGTDTATDGFFEIGEIERVRARYGQSSYINLTPYPSTGYQNSLVTGVTASPNNLYDSGFNDVDGGVTTARSPLIQMPDDGITNIDFEYFYGSNGVIYSSGSDNTDPTDYFRVSVVDPVTNESQVIFQRGSKNPDNRTYKGDALWYELDLASKFVDFPETAVDPLFVAPNGDISSFNGREIYIQVEASDGVEENSIEVGVDNISITNEPVHAGFVNVANVTGDYEDQTVTDTDPSEVIIPLENCVVPVDQDKISFLKVIYPLSLTYGRASGWAPDEYDLEASFNADNTVSLRGSVRVQITDISSLFIEIDLLFSEHTLDGNPYPASSLQNGTATDGEFFNKVTGTMISYGYGNDYPSYIYTVSNRGPNALIGTGASTRHPNTYGLGAWLDARNLTTQYIQGGSHSSLDFAISIDRANCVNVSANPQTSTVFEDDFEANTGWVVDPLGTDTATEGLFEVANPEETKTRSNTQYYRGEYAWQHSVNPDGSEGNTLVTGALAGEDWLANDVNGVTSVRSPDIQIPQQGITLLDLSYYFSHGHGIPDPERDYFKLTLVDDIGNELALVDERVPRYDWGGLIRAHSDPSVKWTPLSVNVSEFSGRTVYLHAEVSNSGMIRESANVSEVGIDDVKLTNRY